MTRTAWLYRAARARRVLRGGCVTVGMINARSQGPDVARAWRPEPHLLERLRAARRYGWTFRALIQTPRPVWARHAPYLPGPHE